MQLHWAKKFHLSVSDLLHFSCSFFPFSLHHPPSPSLTVSHFGLPSAMWCARHNLQKLYLSKSQMEKLIKFVYDLRSSATTQIKTKMAKDGLKCIRCYIVVCMLNRLYTIR